MVQDGQTVDAGDVLVKIPRESAKQKDITGGLPRVVELFEVLCPKEPAVITEVNGLVKFGDVTKSHRKVLVVTPEGEEHEYPLPRGAHVNVREGEAVPQGEASRHPAVRLTRLTFILLTTPRPPGTSCGRSCSCRDRSLGRTARSLPRSVPRARRGIPRIGRCPAKLGYRGARNLRGQLKNVDDADGHSTNARTPPALSRVCGDSIGQISHQLSPERSVDGNAPRLGSGKVRCRQRESRRPQR